MTVALEQLADGSISDRNFQKLMRIVLDTGGQTIGIRVGTSVLTWAGGNQFTGTLASIAHGLGKTPKVILATPQNPPVNAYAWTGTISSTVFSLTGQTTAAAPVAGTTMTVGWVAIG